MPHETAASAAEHNIFTWKRTPILKRLLAGALTSAPATALLAPFLPRSASVLFLHRFSVPDLGVVGHDPATLRRDLEYLRRRRYHIIGVSDLIAHIDQGIPLKRPSVVFTVDDGYTDFADVAAPIFAAYDCPVTVFLITDFVSGRLWNWFDRVPWIFENTELDGLHLHIAGHPFARRWTNAAEAALVAEEVIELLKRVADSEKEALIRAISDQMEVTLPSGVPSRDRAMSWNQVRECARLGVTFGPHTVTHPILSQVDSTRSSREITDSWQTLRAQTESAVPVFCYPNGTPLDFSEREKASVAKAGMTAALSTVQLSVSSRSIVKGSVDRFAIPRYPYPESLSAFIQIVSGIEALKPPVRG
ncbi:MAG TPA: polysaccharide deacetylase family protein [Gemmatimonadaceae bacterium]|nr:polysaccharide deacetylase family protein [Gemmatimonadaceae bacterium]